MNAMRLEIKDKKSTLGAQEAIVEPKDASLASIFNPLRSQINNTLPTHLFSKTPHKAGISMKRS
jgi:hypothetical protein